MNAKEITENSLRGLGATPQDWGQLESGINQFAKEASKKESIKHLEEVKDELRNIIDNVRLINITGHYNAELTAYKASLKVVNQKIKKL